MSISASATSQASRPTAQEILPLLRAHHHIWAERFHLRRIGLYSFGEACGNGSVVRGEATVSSDVDVWVELDPLTPFAMVHLKQELEQLLQRPVDLVRLRERMNPALRQAILSEGIST
jgi:predicted nucleotidyltransferase